MSLRNFPAGHQLPFYFIARAPAPPILLFAPTLGLSLPVDSPLPPISWAQISEAWEWGAGELGVPLGTENFLFLLGSGSQVPALGLAIIMSLGGLVGRGTSGSGSKMDSTLSFPESLGEGGAG